VGQRVRPPQLAASFIFTSANVNRGTVGDLGLRVGMGCMELHDRIMVGVRTERLALDEAWSFSALCLALA
jgi:hypothetical protein